jgi:SAM-dependent methyltransferase
MNLVPPALTTNTTSVPDAALLSSRLQRYVLFDRVNRPYLDWQLEQFRPYLGRRVLEVGCGVGGIIDLLGPRELICGLDVEPEVLDYARGRFRGRPECRFELLDVTTAPPEKLADLQAQRFDSIVCINVLEHIEDDLGALRRMEGLLVPGGTLALLVPAHQWLYGPYDRLDGHFRRYSKSRLRTLLAQTGLQAVRLRYFNSVGALGWWVQYKLLRRTIHGEGQFGIMNRLVPVLRRVEKLIPPPFGLSLVGILRRVP